MRNYYIVESFYLIFNSYPKEWFDWNNSLALVKSRFIDAKKLRSNQSAQQIGIFVDVLERYSRIFHSFCQT